MARACLALLCGILAVDTALAQTDAKAEVVKAEAAFSEAKIHNDVAALKRIIADDYLGINQWGARRNKAQVLELFRDFKITSLVPSHVNVRVIGDIVIVDGVMHESASESFLFMRTYVKRQGTWLLLSSTQNFVMDETFKVYDPELVYQ